MPIPAILIALVVLIFVAFGIYKLTESEPKPNKQVVEVQVFRPPPPPPPKVEEEPPPPELEEEIDIPEPEPEPMPDIPDLPEAPPADMLGLDADGSAGSDQFGLAARRGGRSLIGSGDRHRWYAQRMKDQVSDFLGSQEEVRATDYTVRLLLWVDDEGRLKSYRLKQGSGDTFLDRLIRDVLDRFKGFSDPPPSGMPQPIQLRIEGNK